MLMLSTDIGIDVCSQWRQLTCTCFCKAGEKKEPCAFVFNCHFTSLVILGIFSVKLAIFNPFCHFYKFHCRECSICKALKVRL